MCTTDRIIDFTFSSDGKVIDIRGKNDGTGPLLITDYCYLDRELIIDKTSRSVKLGGQQQHRKIVSIAELRTVFEQLITMVQQIVTNTDSGIKLLGLTIGNGYEKEINLFPEPINLAFDLSISNVEKNLLIEQLIFDILFDKYLQESKLMTRNSYANYMAEKLHPYNKTDFCHAINERLKRGMATHHDRVAYSKLPKQIEMLGADPEKYVEYYNPRMRENPHNKKPKFIWDMLYYNFVLDVTDKQYRRQLTRSSRNYPYAEIISNFQAYNQFVTKLLPEENESCEKYFRMSMDYYVLEFYKRVDFIFRLISILPQISLDKITKDHFLVKRFHPLVLVPYPQNGKLRVKTKHNYYRPLFQAENALHRQKVHTDNYSSTLSVKIQKYQIIRAKAYELFKYHYAFISDDYVEIKKFLCECYDMRSYHQSNTFWDLIQGNDWKKIDSQTQQQLKDQIRNFLSINDAYFWKSSDREPHIPDK